MTRFRIAQLLTPHNISAGQLSDCADDAYLPLSKIDFDLSWGEPMVAHRASIASKMVRPTPRHGWMALGIRP
jgi:hypothetical protein